MSVSRNMAVAHIIRIREVGTPLFGCDSLLSEYWLKTCHIIDHSSLHEKKLVVERIIVFWVFLMMERDTEDPFFLHKDIKV